MGDNALACTQVFHESLRSQEMAEPSMELVHWADGGTTTKKLHVSYFYSELLYIGKKNSELSVTQRNEQIDSKQFRCPSRILS